MALLKLQNIGKIYVSEGSVSVGIRGVNAEFDRGEFVAVTGASGSGKSTLLNVISGMDSYEEGELFVEGEPTSHFTEKDREEFREKYISFIFQDYNILESFTVLQNVELALMQIEDPRERRRRALALLERVGLSRAIHQKGSKLSGGQKQRTVIARALAKDSPIILADEPTGNLDSASSAEIISLLREVSKDKLLIVVTHNLEEVEAYATREIRVFDGAVASDHMLRQPERTEALPEEAPKAEEKTSGKAGRKKKLKDGIRLGWALFTAKPKLTAFLFLLLLVGTLGMFYVTSACRDVPELLRAPQMFSEMEGRVVLTRDDGGVLTAGELEDLADDLGAKRACRYDYLLDKGIDEYVKADGIGRYFRFACRFGRPFDEKITGRFPIEEDEVLLYLPLSEAENFGRDSIKVDSVTFCNMRFTVTGTAYYIDNNQDPLMVFTEEGFELATCLKYVLSERAEAELSAVSASGAVRTASAETLYASSSLPSRMLYASSPQIEEALKDDTAEAFVSYRNYYTDYAGDGGTKRLEIGFGEDRLSNEKPDDLPDDFYNEPDALVLGTGTVRELGRALLKDSYRQASLFFSDSRAAEKAAEKLRDTGYIAVTSDTRYTPTVIDVILNTLGGIALGLFWVLAVIFFAFLIHLCSSRAVGAFKNDLAILRSMGIGADTVRVSLFARMYMTLIPAFLLISAAVLICFRIPRFNGAFSYLYPWQYILIFLGLFLICTRVSFKQVKKLFGQSVKTALRGGDAA